MTETNRTDPVKISERPEKYAEDYGMFLPELPEELNGPTFTENEISITALEDIEEKPVEWLVPGWIPKGQITILAGAGESSKTSAWVSIVSSVSSGRATFLEGYEGMEETREPGKVLFFSGEDSVSVVLKKRFRENQTKDQKNILTIEMNDPRFNSVKFNSDFLECLIKKYKPLLCVFDPIQAFIPERVKMSERNQMRQNLKSLIAYGERYGTAFLVIVHTNKLQGAFGRNRIADSADLWDISRSVMLAGESDRKENLFYISHEKSNYGKKMKTVEFKNVKGVPVFWRFSDKTDRDYVMDQIQGRNQEKQGGNVLSCIEFIRSVLSELEENEAIQAKELQKELKAVGFTSYQYREAVKSMKESREIDYKKSGFGKEWAIYPLQNMKE